MNKNPTVSVIIPTYNRAHLIGKAIQSVLNQSYQDFEIIVLDDCSTDDTEELIKELEKKDERIRYIWHEKNKGPAASRNSGINAAKGRYIAFLDSDDEWLPEKLYKHMMVFKDSKKKVGVVYSGFLKIKNSKKVYIPSPHVIKKEGNIHKELLKGNFIGTPAAIVRKECFRKIGNFDIRIPYLEDWELWIRISKYYEFKYIPEPLVISYFSLNGVNEKPSYIAFNVLNFIVNKYREEFNRHKEILSTHYFGLGKILYLDGKLIKGRKYFMKAIKVYPFNIKYLLGYFVSFFGLKTFNKVIKIYHKFKYFLYNFI